MPIEIRELRIKTTLHERERPSGFSAEQSVKHPGLSRKEKAEIIAECMRNLRQMVQPRNER